MNNLVKDDNENNEKPSEYIEKTNMPPIKKSSLKV